MKVVKKRGHHSRQEPWVCGIDCVYLVMKCYIVLYSVMICYRVMQGCCECLMKSYPDI